MMRTARLALVPILVLAGHFLAAPLSAGEPGSGRQEGAPLATGAEAGAWGKALSGPREDQDRSPVEQAAARAEEAGKLGRARTGSLHRGDVIQVRVYQEPDLDAEVKLDQRGTVMLPLIGQVQVGGLTTEESAKVIADLYEKDYLVHAQVSVNMLQRGPERTTFTVLGQVNRPGLYDYPLDDVLNLLQGIAMAGGYSRLGAPSKVTVQRVEKGQTRVFRLDAGEMSRSRDAPPFALQPDDVITVGEKLF